MGPNLPSVRIELESVLVGSHSTLPFVEAAFSLP